MFATCSLDNLILKAGELSPEFVFFVLTMAFVGAISHCTLMCSPFVSAQVSNKLESKKENELSEFLRFKMAVLPFYHLGRITSYTFVGALVGALSSKIIFSDGVVSNIANLVLVSLGLMLIVYSIFGWQTKQTEITKTKVIIEKSNSIKTFFSNIYKAWQNLIRSFLVKNTMFAEYFLGFLSVLLPCGFLYGGFSLAAASGSAFSGAVVMFIFALGTVLPLIAVAMFGDMFLNVFKSKLGFLSRALTAGAGFWLCFTALSSFLTKIS